MGSHDHLRGAGMSEEWRGTECHSRPRGGDVMGSHEHLRGTGVREAWKDPECHLDLEVVIHGIT